MKHNYILLFTAYLFSSIVYSQQSPYGGTAWEVPGLIEAENYDDGGEGIAYHDTDAENLGANFRTTEGVDTPVNGAGGYKIGYIKHGEWVEYTINVTQETDYYIKLKIGSPSSNGKLRIEINDEDKTGLVAIPNTGGYDSWQNLKLELKLDTGEQVLKIYFETTDSYVADLDSFELVTVESSANDSFFDNLFTERLPSNDEVIWTQVAPGNSGFANLTRYHPTIAGKVLSCPDMLNAYQSDNNGESWYNIRDYDGNSDFQHLRDAYYSPTSPEFGLAIEGSRLWKTDTFGKSWDMITNCPWYEANPDGSDRSGWKSKIGSLGLDPNNKNTWYVGGGRNVRGQDWLSCYKDNNANTPRGTSSDFEGKLWKTTNGGTSWTLINSGLNSKAQIGRIIVNPKNSNQIFVSSQYGVYRSNNGGSNWTQITNGKLDNDIIMDMDFYYNKSTGKFTLYLIDQVHYVANGSTTKCTGGIYRSNDEGDTWVQMNGDLYLDINKLTGGVPYNYYKYISKWFNITEATAKSTYPNLPTKALQYFSMLSVDPSRENALYIGFEDPQVQNSIMPGRIWSTSDDGDKWINTARLGAAWEKDKSYWQSRGNPYQENMVVGHRSPHFVVNDDYPLRSCRYITVGADGSVMMISDHSTMLSTDHGETWNQVDEDYTPSGGIMGRGNSNLPAECMMQDKRLDNIILGSGEHNLWIPTNDGTNGRQALEFISSAQQTISAIAVDTYNPKIMYTTSFRQAYKQNIFRSTDAGYHWENYGVATPVSNTWEEDMRTHALMVNPIDNNIMYFGITDMSDLAYASFNNQNGFYFSNDKGKTFKMRNNGLPTNRRVQDIELDPRDTKAKSLFIACEKNTFDYNKPIADGGLYHTTNLGETWTKVKTPSSIQGVTHITIDNTNRMYITTGFRGGGNGVWYSDDFGENWHHIFKYDSAECIDVSPFDHNLIVVTVGFLSKNPGVYVSLDRGLTWTKNNNDIGIQHRISMVEFDIHNPDQLWLSTVGSGFYIGKIKGGNTKSIKIEQKSIEFDGETEKQLKAEIINNNFAGKEIIWKSSNPAIASVDQNGLVISKSRGQVKIWASIEDGRYADYSVITVHKASETGGNRFKIKTTSSTCTDLNNGKISIEILRDNNYKLLVTHNGNEESFSFSENFEIENLSSGIYNLKFSIDGDSKIVEEFNLKIEEPKDLFVSSKVDKLSKKVTLNLSGGKNYTIIINNNIYTTKKSEIVLNLEKGENKVSVKTDKECQGSFNETIAIGEELLLYPNPFNSRFNIDLGLDSSSKAEIKIFSSIGTLVYTKIHKVQQGKVVLNTNFLNNGMYMLSVKTELNSKNLKIIKQ